MRLGHIVESTSSRPKRYHLVLDADAGSVPCSAATCQITNHSRLAISHLIEAKTRVPSATFLLIAKRDCINGASFEESDKVIIAHLNRKL